MWSVEFFTVHIFPLWYSILYILSDIYKSESVFICDCISANVTCDPTIVQYYF